MVQLKEDSEAISLLNMFFFTMTKFLYQLSSVALVKVVTSDLSFVALNVLGKIFGFVYSILLGLSFS